MEIMLGGPHNTGKVRANIGPPGSPEIFAAITINEMQTESHRNANTISAAAGVPGGFAMAATVPADLA